MSSLPVIFLMGPTASGKTAMTIHLARHLPVDLISVDSALVYREMDIGTAKPDAATLQQAPHALIDIIDPTQAFSAADFRTAAQTLIRQSHEQGRIPLLVGGTMLYYQTLQHGIHDLPQADAALRAQLDHEALQHGWPAMHARLAVLDPQTAARLSPADSQRIQRALEVCLVTGRPMSSLFEAEPEDALQYPLLKIALEPSDRSVLHDRIALRFDQMLEQGLEEEVAQLRVRWPTLSLALPSMRCVGYRQMWEYQDGVYDRNAMREKGIIATRQLAKRQLTWLRGMTDTVRIDCLDGQATQRVEQEILRFINA